MGGHWGDGPKFMEKALSWTKRKLSQLKKTSLKLKLNSLMILILLY